MIQLREKYSSAREFYDDALKAVSYAHQHGTIILINDRADVAMAVGANGVHLGQTDILPEDARKVLGEAAIIGYSTHSITQAKAAAEMPVDYIAIGPVFPTSSKEGPDRAIGPEGVTAVRKLIDRTPLVAIGGITAANAEGVMRSGADSVAIISSLLNEADKISVKYQALARELNNIVQHG